MVHPSLEALRKRKQKKRKCLGDPPARKHVKVVHQVIVSESSNEESEADPSLEHPEGDSTEALSTYDIGNSEFDAPFDLKDLPAGLRERMISVAPVLQGRDAEYSDAFFRDCVGLCDRGPTVDEVPKVYPEILESDIKAVWLAGAQQNRYEIVNCKDKEQVRLFSQHNYLVYGNRPDNAYFAMRFLKAAFATFVYHKDVNWVAEAERRRTKCLATASRNPWKIGPVALRRQVEGLCEIIAYLATGTSLRRRIPQTVEAAQRELDVARCAEASAAKALLSTQQNYADAKESLLTSSDEEFARLEAQSKAASEEQNRLYSTGTPSEFKVAAEVARGLAQKLVELQEAQMVARATVRDLEAGPLDQASADHTKSLEVVATAEAAVLKAKQGSLVLSPRKVFEYPIGRSVPAIESNVTQSCSVCSKGFVAKAAILSSCGCLFHNVCMAEMMDSNNKVCPTCTSRLDPAWVAQWDGQINDNEEKEIEASIVELGNSIEDETNPVASTSKPILEGTSLLSKFDDATKDTTLLSEFEADEDDPPVSCDVGLPAAADARDPCC